MKNSTENILNLEYGYQKKTWANRLRIGLIYPNTYYVGMSNLGFQTVYSLFNDNDAIVCERFFFPKILPGKKFKPQSIESANSPEKFHILAFSVSFENDYLNVISFIEQSGLNRLREKRHAKDPLIIAGGAAISINPEALADFVDFFVLGEIEPIINDLLQNLQDCYSTGWNKNEALELTSFIPGIYQPAGYNMKWFSDGTLSNITAKKGFPEHVQPQRLAKLDDFPTHSQILTPNTEFNKHFLIEISRGCSKKCKFCYGAYGYAPLRIRSKNNLILQVEKALGISQELHRNLTIGLMAPAMSDCPWIGDIIDHILYKGLHFSLSSVPLSFLTKKNLNRLKAANIKSITLAPETGSDRLRILVTKKWDTNFFYSILPEIWQRGIFKLRLYFIIGFPTEDKQDVVAIVQFVKKILHLHNKYSLHKQKLFLHISVNSFVPKPHTPLERAPMLSKKEILVRMRFIQRELRNEKFVTVTHDTPKWARLQGLLARADRRVSPFLAKLVDNNGNISKAASEININSAFYLDRKRSDSELLPWNHLTRR